MKFLMTILVLTLLTSCNTPKKSNLNYFYIYYLGNAEKKLTTMLIYDESINNKDFIGPNISKVQSKKILNLIQQMLSKTNKKMHVLNNYTVEVRSGSNTQLYILDKQWVPVIKEIIANVSNNQKEYFSTFINIASSYKQNKSTEWLLEWNRELENNDHIPSGTNRRK